jgi:DNA-binding FadR family transcriptional regulator
LGAYQEVLEPACAELAARHPERKEKMRPFLDAATVPLEGAGYHANTVEFHNAVYELAGNGVLTLITKAITRIVTTHIVSTMDPVELHASIIEEHSELARTIIAGHAAKAARLTAAHFRAQHDYYRERWPARFEELIEWR